MAQAHRLLDQVEYFSWIVRVAHERPDRMFFGTWGLSSKQFGSPAENALRMARMMSRDKPQVLVGATNLNHMTSAHQYELKGIEYRYTQLSHAKYALARFDGGSRWLGVLGSTNLTDTGQMNLNVELSEKLVREVYRHHMVQWRQAQTVEDLLRVLRNTEALERTTVYKANDMGSLT